MGKWITDHWVERVGTDSAVGGCTGAQGPARSEPAASPLPYAAEQRTLKATLSGVLTGSKASLELMFRRPGDLPVALPPKPIMPGVTREFAIPRLAAGDYYVDARVVGAAGVENLGHRAAQDHRRAKRLPR